MYKWFLAWRYLHTKLIAIIGVAGVALCVMLVLVVTSVMGGFLDTIRSRSKGLHSEIVLEGGTLQGFPYYEEFGQYLQEHLPDVVRLSTPAIYTYGIFRVPQTTWTKPARILGVRLDDYVQVNAFKKGLHYERYYPGSTHLGPQGMPIAGFDVQTERATLPTELEEANARWRSAELDSEVIAEFEAAPFEISPHPYVTPAFPGRRAYAAVKGDPFYADPMAPGVIVGCDLLNVRRPDGDFNRPIARGTMVALTLLPLTQRGNIKGEPPVRWNVRYVDDSRTGIYEIDSICAYVDFDLAQHKLAMDAQELAEGGFSKPRTNQLLIGLPDGADLNESWEKVSAAWLSFRASLGMDISEADVRLLELTDVYTWEDLQRPFIAAVEKEKVLMLILFALMGLVAVLLLGCIFYMIVEKKTRDIGILKSLGASPRGVAGLFLGYACAIGVVGAVSGVLLGAVFVWNINGIQDYLASLDPALRVWSPDVYSFDRIPEVVKREDAFWIGFVAVIASMVGAVIPAIVAGRVWPVQALRYE